MAAKKTQPIDEQESAEPLEGLGDDDNSTHPSLDRRVVRLRDMIEGIEKGKQSFFLVGEAKFALMQKMARHELLLVYMQRADYGQLMFGKSGFDGMRQQQVQQIVAHEALEIDADARCDRIR